MPRFPPRLLLISNSTVYGRGYLDHVADEIRAFLGSRKTILFVPFALYDRKAYAEKVRTRLVAMDYEVESVDQASSVEKKIERADAIFVGGGNTFRLFKSLYAFDLLEPLRRQ